LIRPLRFAAIALSLTALAPSTGGDTRVPREWVASQHRIEAGPGLPAVDVDIFLAPDRERQRERYRVAAAVAITHFSQWFGVGPHARLTIADAPWNAAATARADEPLVLASGQWLNFDRASEPEASILTGIAEKWFATTEQVLRKGLALYLAHRALAEEYENRAFVGRFFGGHIPMIFRSVATAEASSREGPPGDPPAETARWMLTAERLLGWPLVQAVLASYSADHRARPGSIRDLQDAFERVSGRNLSWFFDQMQSRATLDFAVERVTSVSIKTDEGTRMRTSVTLARKGDGTFPGRSRPAHSIATARGAIPVRVDFASGESVDETWNGRDAHYELTFLSSSPPVAVRVDPDRVLASERRRVDNSWTVRPRAADVALVWSARWLVWLEHCILGFAALA